MPKALVRQADGTLVEQDVPEVTGGGAVTGGGPLGQPAPSTPKGAAAQGATPDQAKMQATPAQKTNALAQNVAAAQDLGLQDRQVGQAPQPAPGAADTASRAKDLAGGLSTLGSYGARIQGLIKARLDAVAAQTASVTVNNDQIAALLPGTAPTARTAAAAALASYAKSGSEDDLAKIRDIFGGDKLAAGGLSRLYTGSPEALAALGQQAQGAVTVGQLDLAGGGIDPATIAKDLGVTTEQLSAMTPDQFRQSVQDRLNTGLSNTAALQAEYKTATPARQQQILAQLRAADASGLTAAEASAGHLADQLAKNETVRFAGADYNIQDLLKSDKVSAVIKAAAANPAALDQLKQQEPALADWIVKNQASLNDFATKATDQAAGLDATQARASALTKDLTPALKSALTAAGVSFSDKSLTGAQVDQLQSTLQGNSLYQAIQADKSGGLKSALEASDDPAALAAKLKGMSAADISTLVDTTNKLQATPGLANVLGIDTSSGLLDPARQRDVAAALATWAKLPPEAQAVLKSGNLLTGAAGIQWAGVHADFLKNPDVTSLIANGSIATGTALKRLAVHPQLIGAIKQVTDEHTSLDTLAKDVASGNSGSLESATKQLFGTPITYATAAELVKQAAATGIPGEARRLTAALDVDGDGKLTETDFGAAAIAARLQKFSSSLPSAKMIIANGGTGFDPVTQFRKDAAGSIKKYGDLAAKAQAAKEQADKDTAEVKQTILPVLSSLGLPTNLAAAKTYLDSATTEGAKLALDPHDVYALVSTANSAVSSPQTEQAAKTQLAVLRDAASRAPKSMAAQYSTVINGIQRLLDNYSTYKMVTQGQGYKLQQNLGTGQWSLVRA